MNKKVRKRLKLSESRGVKLPDIRISPPAVFFTFQVSILWLPNILHPIDLKINPALKGGVQQLPTPLQSRLHDSLDITIYWADEQGLFHQLNFFFVISTENLTLL
ncbi:unnamed protein product [Gongylonema pulchrum]|uniref:Uncharacterized protein n=1 Tax=Gongylonema pulchrum TaxID=637853 RepID=A0A183EU41_9BILA|nr:unnamed protein product [Gongylonema pulchrum]